MILTWVYHWETRKQLHALLSGGELSNTGFEKSDTTGHWSGRASVVYIEIGDWQASGGVCALYNYPVNTQWLKSQPCRWGLVPLN